MLISTLNKTYLLFVLQTVTSQTKIFLSVLVYNMNTIMLKREVTKLGPSTIKKGNTNRLSFMSLIVSFWCKVHLAPCQLYLGKPQ
jgi:hypothetical protein